MSSVSLFLENRIILQPIFIFSFKSVIRPIFRPFGNSRPGGLCVIVREECYSYPCNIVLRNLSLWRKETKHCTVYSLSTVLSFTAIEGEEKKNHKKSRLSYEDQVYLYCRTKFNSVLEFLNNLRGLGAE
jgi:hypothetical protein